MIFIVDNETARQTNRYWRLQASQWGGAPTMWLLLARLSEAILSSEHRSTSIMVRVLTFYNLLSVGWTACCFERSLLSLSHASGWVSSIFLCFPCPGYRNFHWSPCFGQDTYFAEGDGMHDFFVYSCASLLLNWSDELKILEFQDLLMFLQCLPTSDWETSQVGLLQKQLIKAGTRWNV